MSDNQEVYMIQTKERIIIKTVVYRIIAIIMSFIINNLFFNNVKKAILLTIIIEFIQMTIYYFYEKIWNIIRWGIEFKIKKDNILDK